MPRASLKSLDRRRFVAGMAASALPAVAIAAARLPVVTLLGDSITAGRGLAAQDALPAQLQAALAGLGVRATVRGSGVSGDTTAGGLARLDFSVQPDTAVCIVELGGNDLLQGQRPADTRANLKRIIDRLKARRIGVVLCGLAAPRGLNAGFARDFNALFPSLAHAEGVPLMPDLLAGVAQRPALNQADGIHPNPKGVKILARNLAPVVARALQGRR
jgi:acyl-CoA thioesterase-1